MALNSKFHVKMVAFHFVLLPRASWIWEAVFSVAWLCDTSHEPIGSITVYSQHRKIFTAEKLSQDWHTSLKMFTAVRRSQSWQPLMKNVHRGESSQYWRWSILTEVKCSSCWKTFTEKCSQQWKTFTTLNNLDKTDSHHWKCSYIAVKNVHIAEKCSVLINCSQNWQPSLKSVHNSKKTFALATE